MPYFARGARSIYQSHLIKYRKYATFFTIVFLEGHMYILITTPFVVSALLLARTWYGLNRVRPLGFYAKKQGFLARQHRYINETSLHLN